MKYVVQKISENKKARIMEKGTGNTHSDGKNDDFRELMGIFDGKKTAVVVTEDDMPVPTIRRGVEKVIEKWQTTKR